MDKNRKIYVFTQAYNAEKTLARTIESVLGQTYENFVYYIADSASTDNTKNIILEYAQKNSKVVPILLEKNKDWEMYGFLQRLLKTTNDGYFCQLDADDAYEPAFFEKILKFMSENKLDIASCTSKYIDGNNLQDMSKILLEKEIIVSGEGFQRLFATYFRFFRDSWGKLFSLKLFEKIDFSKFDTNIMSGSVSYLCFEALLHADKVGIYAEQLHNYYVYSDSFERNPENHTRILTPSLYSCYYYFLQKKCGRVSKINREFLINSYCNSMNSKLDKSSLSVWDVNIIEKTVKCLMDNDFFDIVLTTQAEKTLELLNIIMDRVIHLTEQKESNGKVVAYLIEKRKILNEGR